MAEKTKPQTTSNLQDGRLVINNDNQTMTMQIYFNHSSKQTFEDKLISVVLAEEAESRYPL